jgi:hypothetical protein
VKRRPLIIDDILRWADQHRESTGHWPTRATPGFAGELGETWSGIDRALHVGGRGLPGGSSLARLLAERRGRRHLHNRPALTEEQILAWADAHYQRTEKWPKSGTGVIADSGGEKWSAVEAALRDGVRGLPGGSSLARLLAARRGVRNEKDLPALTEDGILGWADAHHARTGAWPTYYTGQVLDAPEETWQAMHMALSQGHRGLPGGSTLALLLAERRGVRNRRSLPELSVEQVLAWADAHHQETGDWPHKHCGPIRAAPEETWLAIDEALARGSRGLPGGETLATLLGRLRGDRNKSSLPRLSRVAILRWADAYQRQNGRWPVQKSGPIAEAPGETWGGIDEALRVGKRGLRRGSSLARLLAQHRGKRNNQDLPPLSQRKILAWADAHQARTGHWPSLSSGEVVDAPGERWNLIDVALRVGVRGLPGKSTLLQLLARKRGVPHPRHRPALTEEQIRAWARQHLARTGSWPGRGSGPIAGKAGETWWGVDQALKAGKRGLPGGSSLAKLLGELGATS